MLTAGRFTRARGHAARAALAATLVAAATAFAAPTAQALPWPCDNKGYVTQFDATGTGGNTLFQRVDRLDDGTYTLTTLGSIVAQHVNAIGFRAQDGFMYAYNNNTRNIVRIERDGAGAPLFTSIGVPPGMPDGFFTVVGTVLADGTYFLWGRDGDANDMGVIVDVSGPSPTLVRVVTPAPGLSDVNFSDFAVNPADDKLYGSAVGPNPPEGPGVYELVLSGATLAVGPRVADGVQGGAQWFSPSSDGTLMIYNNGNGTLYSSDLGTGGLTLLGSAPTASNTDGTACANTLAVTKDAAPRTAVAGTEVTYTYEVTARGLVDNPVDFVDELPAGMTYVPGGVTVTPAFGTTNDYGGTGTLALSGTIPRNATITISARVLVAASATCDVTVPNQAQATMHAANLPDVTIDSDDPTTDEPDDPTDVRVTCAADLRIAKAAPATVARGDRLTWTLTISNDGPSDSPAATVSDTLPPEITDPVAETPGCAVAGRTVTCAVGALAAGATTEIAISGTAPDADETCVTNVATVIGVLPDPDASNNVGSATTCTPPPPLTPPGPPTLPPPVPNTPANVTIAKTASAPAVALGGSVSYTLTVRNDGPGTATDTIVSDTVPSRLDARSATSTQGDCTVTGNAVRCTLGTLSAGQTVTVTVRAVAIRAGATENAARVTSRECMRAPCDEDRAKVRVTKGKLTLSKRASKPSVRAGETFRYTLRVTNPNGVTVRDVKVCDRLPAGLVLVRSSPKAKLSNGQYCWTIARLGARQSRQITLTVRALPGASGRKVNRATATSPDTAAVRAQRAVTVADTRVRAGGVTG